MILDTKRENPLNAPTARRSFFKRTIGLLSSMAIGTKGKIQPKPEYMKVYENNSIKPLTTNYSPTSYSLTGVFVCSGLAYPPNYRRSG